MRKFRDNVFADLGLATSEEDFSKAELARKINAILAKKNLTQVQAARVLDIDSPSVPDLVNGKISKFTLDDLVRISYQLRANLS